MNIAGQILRHERTRADAPALVEGDRTLTYGELAGLVRRTAGHLARLGLRHGDRIGLCLKDSCDHLAALLAAGRIGAVAVPLDWRAKSGENGRIVDGLGLAFVVAEPDLRATDGCPTMAMDDAWHHEVARCEPGDDPPGDWNDPFVISATSGSTGDPKLRLTTHLQCHFGIAGMLELMALSGRHRFLCPLPLYYAAGRASCLIHLTRGDCVVLYPSVFSPADYVEVATRQRITVGSMVPSVVRQLLAAGGSEPLLPGMALLSCTGAPLHAEEKRQALRKLTPNFQERYGTAETFGISVLRPEDFAERPDSVGQPHSLAEVEIVDDEDRLLPSGAVGQLRLRGPSLATPLPGRAIETSFRNGWFYPGEIARLDAAGYLFLEGRMSDVIMRSGAKVYPAEVERTLCDHPDVLEAAVVGQRGADNEEVVIAFVVPRGELATGALLAHCRAQLTAHKVPRQIHLVEELPKSTAGKIDKLALAKSLAARAAP